MRDDQDLIPTGLRAERVSIDWGERDHLRRVGRAVRGRLSGRVHNVYERTASDLPWHGGEPPGPRSQVLLRPRVVRKADLSSGC